MRCVLSEPGCRILAPDGGVCPLPWSSSSRCSRASTRFLSRPHASRRRLCRRLGSIRISPPLRSIRATSPSRRNIRSGPTAPRSAAGYRCRRAAPSTAPIRTPGCFRSARACGRSSRSASGGGRSHTIPGVNDCKACHQGGRSEVLGFSALQLSPHRDPGALHADAAGVDLTYLVEKGLITGLPKSLLDKAPRIAAASPTERAALGYLHGNCGHCHNPQGPLQNVGLFLRQAASASVSPAIASAVGQPVRKPAPGQSPEAVLRIEPGHPERSGIMQRIASRYPALQMPPLGTALTDEEAIALIERWIAQTETVRKEAQLQQKEP